MRPDWHAAPAKKMIKKTLSIMGFFLIMALWLVMATFTISYWLLGEELQMNTAVDISVLTTLLLPLNLMNNAVWLGVYILFPLINSRWILRQQLLVARDFPVATLPLVSIIIPARDEENVIARTVLNCLKQTYKNIEVIVVCHNCNDETYERARMGDKRTKVFNLKNSPSGKGVALNFGLDKAQGEFICIVDSDGILAPNFLEITLPLFRLGYSAVQGKIEPSNRSRNLITRLLGLESDLFSYPYMVVRDFLSRRTPLGGTGFIIRKDLLISEGKFDNGLIDDFQLSFKLFRRGHRIGFAPLSVVFDEKPPTFDLLFRQRSRWVKGHIDLLKKKVPESKDFLGMIHWLIPISMFSGLLLVLVTSFGIIYLFIFGYYPYRFTFIPVTIWLSTVAASYMLQVYILLQKSRKRTMRDLVHTAILIPFSYYWYIVLIKAFFVKSWANTKTTHGFDSPENCSYESEPDVTNNVKK